MEHSDLCPDCQKKMPLMDYDKAVEVIKRIIALETIKHDYPYRDLSDFNAEKITDLARLAHEAIYSTPKED